MNTNKYVCDICNKIFYRKCSLSYHLSHTLHKKCLQCGVYIENTSKFCSSHCSQTYNNKLRVISEEQRLKTSESLKTYYQSHHKGKEKKTTFCKVCKNQIRENKTGFCAKCLRYSNNIDCIKCRQYIGKLGGSFSAKKQYKRKRSRNEIYFATLVHTIYPDSCDNIKMFNDWDADIVIPSLKIAILWNGIWHYNDICGQLRQTKNRDRLKYSEIVKYGYKPYIIVDMGKFSKEKCLKELQRFKEFITILESVCRVKNL